MNRLWVRFSLVLFALVLVMPMIVLLNMRQTQSFQPVAEQISELLDVIPMETWLEIRQIVKDQMIDSSTRIAVLGSTFSLVIGVLLAHSLTAPLRAIEKGAQAIEKQDLSYRVAVRGSQEIRSLAGSFNSMAERLEQAEKLRNELLADVAHELRGPLHLLQGNLQAILDDVYPLNKKEIANLFDQTNHITHLVNDLHTLAQAEARQLPFDKQPTEFATLTKEVVNTLKPVAQKKGVTIQVELLGAQPTVLVDASRMRQVMLNLLSNALRHTPAAGEVWVTLESLADTLQIRVRDTGEGIAPENLQRVFDRFYRTDSARSREKGGSGLGLAIAKAFVEGHGGEMNVTSKGPGHGTIFSFRLPLE